MNQKLTNEEIARVFAMYLGQKAILSIDDIPDFLTSVDIYNMTVDFTSDFNQSVEEIKVLLTPLSKITDEHAIEVVDILFPTNTLTAINGKAQYVGKTTVLFHLCNVGFSDENEHNTSSSREIILEIQPFYVINAREYLIQKGYDLPTFFGINHWANGKTAIELGIAIDKTSN